MAVIGIDIGGTKISGAIFENDEIVYREKLLLQGKGGDDAGNVIIELTNTLLSYAENKGINISGIGASVPGIYYSKTGNVWAPNISGWENYPLLEKLKLSVPQSINIKIDSDRACYILGEVWKGNAQGIDNAIFMAVGTGIGAGILADGNIVRGANDIAGAIGWLALDKPFYAKYINYGCYEYHASGDGLARVAKEILPGFPNSIMLNNKPVGDITAHDVFSAAELNDAAAVKTLKIAVEFWGMAAANLVSLFNPEVIIFGGGVFGPAVKYLDEIYNEAKKWAQPISITKVKFLPSKAGGEAGLWGAGYLAKC